VKSKGRSIGLPLLIVMSLLVAACSEDGTEVTTTSDVSVTRAPTTTAGGGVGVEEPEVGPEPLRIGLTASVTTDNWFAAFGQEDGDQNRAFLQSSKTSLFSLSVPGFTYIPELATSDSLEIPTEQDGVWMVEQTIRSDWVWSDGVPITAHDLAFYFDTVRELDLGSAHADAFGPTIRSVTASDDHTVRIEFSTSPTFTDWSSGVGVAPFLPRHFWQPHVDAARAFGDATRAGISEEQAIQGVVTDSLADDDPSNDLVAGDVTPDAVTRYIEETGTRAAVNALYEVSGDGEPSVGPLIVDRWDKGEFVRTVANPSYLNVGNENTLYADGSFRVTNEERGEDMAYGGDGRGQILARYVESASLTEILWIEHVSREEAYESLAADRVDFVYDTIGATTELRDQLSASPDIEFSESESDRLRYLGFNLRKPPMSDIAFRRAVATIIDKEQVAEETLSGAVHPAYTLVAPGLVASHNPDVERAGWFEGSPMSTADRLDAAIAILREAGYTWSTEPVVVRDLDGVFVEVNPRGEGLTMPNGQRVPELAVLAPGEEHDPYRATYATHLESQAQEIGIPIVAELTDFDSIVAAVFPPQTPESVLQWDLYMLAWGSGTPVPPGILLRAIFHSDQDTVEYGGFNTTGYRSPEFDETANAFDAATDAITAGAMTRDMEAIIARDLPYVVLFRIPILEGYRSRVRFPVANVLSGHSGFANVWPSAVEMTE